MACRDTPRDHPADRGQIHLHRGTAAAAAAAAAAMSYDISAPPTCGAGGGEATRKNAARRCG